ncbi:MAG TPA: RNA polymerase sigma factor [Oleiagrimonas sp.]|nr:RNA polymerase sigma factor [Oleiagrimonas sp.]
MEAATDAELMQAYARGDMDAFDALYARHRGSLYRFLLGTTRDRAIAEELFQETWQRVVRARHAYRPEAAFRTWLWRIARNLVIDHARRRKPVVTGEPAALAIAGAAAPAALEPLRVLAASEDWSQLVGALEELSEAQRIAFLLRMEEGLSIQEIADVTGVGRETAKSRLRYAMKHLRQRVRP